MRRQLSLLIALVLITVCGALPGEARAVDSTTDIPGVTWPGRSADSTVGGAIYDRVWRLELTAGRVAQIRLEGLEPGAELGLYLLDESITSLAAPDFDTHVLKRSAKPGATQSVTAALVPGTYYLHVNGRNADRAYRFRITATLFPDATPPLVTTSLAGGKNRVSTVLTTLRLTARDSLSGVSAYRTRVGEAPWSDWIAVDIAPLINLEVPIELQQVTTLQRVDVQAKNTLGLISDTVSDSVYLDQVAPRARRIDREGAGGITTRSRPIIIFSFNEPLNKSSWLNGGLLVTTPEDNVVEGIFTYSATLRRGTWQPKTAIPLGTTLFFAPGEAQDLAGNYAEMEPFALTYLAVTKLTGGAVPATPYIDRPLTLTVTSAGVPQGSTVWLERFTGSEWEGYLPATISSSVGRLGIGTPESGRYRWHFSSDGLRKDSFSTEFVMAVRPRVSLIGESISSPRVVPTGQAIAVAGVINPARSTVNMLLYRCNSTFSVCILSTTVPMVVGDDGRFTHSWTPAKGYWAWKATSVATADFSAGSSPLYKFRAP